MVKFLHNHTNTYRDLDNYYYLPLGQHDKEVFHQLILQPHVFFLYIYSQVKAYNYLKLQ